MTRRALFLACSGRKATHPGLLPAVERYDGPCFRVLRRYLRSSPEDSLGAWVLSGEYGLIHSSAPIPAYNRRMTLQRSEELKEVVRETFARAWEETLFDDVFVCLGSAYARVMADCWAHLPPNVSVRFATGAIGGRASQLRAWLYRNWDEVLPSSVGKGDRVGRASLLGVTVEATPEDVLKVAQKGLVDDPDGANRFQTWCVPIGSSRVAPKWLVARLIGLPVSRFRTADAVRFLAMLGVQCRSAGQLQGTNRRTCKA